VLETNLYPQINASHDVHKALSETKLLDGIVVPDDKPVYAANYHLDDIAVKAQRAIERDPELGEFILNTTDGVHGTRSGSLMSILEHGLVPQSEHNQFAYPITTVEFHSLPKPRPYIHLLHWLYAEQTKNYSETPDGPITPSNFEEAILDDEIFAMVINPNRDTIYTAHMRNRHMTALALREYLLSGYAHSTHIDMLNLDAPVVLGVSTRELDQSKITSVESVVLGDNTYEGRIPETSITSVFVPEKHISKIAPMTNKPVFALERLRQMTDNLV
jgi:hypothetical protein